MKVLVPDTTANLQGASGLGESRLSQQDQLDNGRFEPRLHLIGESDQ